MAEDQDPLGRGWKLAGGLLALILVAVVLGFLLVPSREDQTPEATEPSPAPTTSQARPAPGPSSPAAAADDGTCPDLSDDTAMPTSAPETTWDRHAAGMVLPTSDEHGPAVQDGDFWRCYSHTPAGALMAGSSLLLAFGSGHIEAAAESPQRESLFDQMQLTSGAELGTIEAYRIIMADQEAAVVEYLMSGGGQNAVMRINLIWDAEANDWRVDLTSGTPTAQVVTDTSGYIAWR